MVEAAAQGTFIPGLEMLRTGEEVRRHPLLRRAGVFSGPKAVGEIAPELQGGVTDTRRGKRRKAHTITVISIEHAEHVDQGPKEPHDIQTPRPALCL